MSQSEATPGPFGLAPGFYTISNCKPLHRKHKQKIGTNDYTEDQVVDLAFDLTIKEKAAREMKFHAALFKPADPALVKTDSEGKLPGMTEPKEYEVRQVGKIGLGDDLDYQTKDYDIQIREGVDAVAILRPMHGLEMKSAEAKDDGIAVITVRCTAKNVDWCEFMLECMLAENDLNVMFIEAKRPKQTKIEDVAAPEEGDSEEVGEEGDDS